MITKIIGLGPRMYVRDYFNIFDASIVILSIIDVSLTFSSNENEIDDANQGKGAISAFRAFRLMRVIKLSKSWT
jgi:hypothetical protein